VSLIALCPTDLASGSCLWFLARQPLNIVLGRSPLLWACNLVRIHRAICRNRRIFVETGRWRIQNGGRRFAAWRSLESRSRAHSGCRIDLGHAGQGLAASQP
jgi:exonuclease III